MAITDRNLNVGTQLYGKYKGQTYTAEVAEHEGSSSTASRTERSSRVGPYVEEEMRRHARDRLNYLNIMRAAFAFDSRTRLHCIACPTLILVGERNRRAHAQAREMARLISQAELRVIPRAGHMLNWDNPEAFNGAVETFLRRALVHAPGEGPSGPD